MADDNGQRCEKCGNPIPIDAPNGICPVCSLRDAMGPDSDDPFYSVAPDALSGGEGGSPMVDPDSVTIPMGAPSREQHQRISGSLSSHRRLQSALRAGKFIYALFWLVLTVYGVIRLIEDRGQVRPTIYLNDELHPTIDLPHLGLSAHARVRSVMGEPVSTLADVVEVYDGLDQPIIDFVFEDSGDSEKSAARLTWARVVSPMNYEVRADGVIELAGEDPILPSLVHDSERVDAINGTALEELTDGPVVTSAPSLPYPMVWYFNRFTLRRENGDSRDLVILAHPNKQFASRLISGLALIGIGLLAFWLKPNLRSTLGFLFFCTILGAFMVLRSIPQWSRFSWENQLYYILQCLVPAAAGIMVITFTPFRTLVKRAWIWCLALAVPVAVLMLWNTMANPVMAHYGMLKGSPFWAWALLLLSLLLASLLMDVWLRFAGRELGPSDRQRAHSYRLAAFCGFLPTAIFTFVIQGRELYGAFAAVEPLVDLSVLLFPALIGYAIVRHNYLNLNELAREGLFYAILLFLFTSLYTSGGALVVPIVESFVPESASWARTVVLAVTIAVIIPAHNLTRRTIQRRYRRIPFQLDDFLQALDEEGKTWQTPADYCHSVALALSRMTRTPNVALVTRYPSQRQWSISAMTPAPSRNTATDSCQMLFALLEEEEAEVFRDDVVENFRYRFIQREIIEGMDTLHASIVFPLVSRGILIGAVALDSKTTGQNYSSEELNVLRRIANHVAHALYGLMASLVVTGGQRIADIWPRCPERIGGYMIERVLGEGGMAYVYLGLRDDRAYAIKLANRFVQSTASLMERFHREASAVQRLQHLNIVGIEEIGWEGPEPFIVFEYVSGGSLRSMVSKSAPPEVDRVVNVAIQIAKGLAAAQAQGIIHRDIKPGNIFLRGEGSVKDESLVKIGDFGLAHIADRSTLTAHGEFFGTPDYMAPELFQGKSATIQSDQYALGVTLFELLTGEMPFHGDSVDAVLYQRLHSDPPAVSALRPEVSERISALVARLLEIDPDSRYPDYDELISELEGCKSVGN